MGKFKDKIIWQENPQKYKLNDCIFFEDEDDTIICGTIIDVRKEKVSKIYIQTQEAIAKKGGFGCTSCKRAGVKVKRNLYNYYYTIQGYGDIDESIINTNLDFVNDKIRNYKEQIEYYQEKLEKISDFV